MPKFSKTSKEKLVTCHRDLQRLCNELIEYTDFTVICGHRTEEEQEEVYENGYSMVPYPMSKHNRFPSIAVDIAPYPIDWENVERWTIFVDMVKMLADKLGINIKCGRDFKSFKDYPHIELVGR